MAIEILHPHLLVVEGEDDAGFFRSFVKHLGFTGIQVLPIGGKTKTRENLKLLTVSPGFSEVATLVICRDADENPTGAFQSVRDSLKVVGLPTPDRPFELCDGEPRVMIMILPEEEKTGALEDLCLSSVRDDAILYCVEQHFQCLKDQTVSLPKNIAKAKVQVFLGSKEASGKSLGVAAQAGYWPMDSNAFAGIRKCLSLIGGQETGSR